MHMDENTHLIAAFEDTLYTSDMNNLTFFDISSPEETSDAELE